MITFEIDAEIAKAIMTIKNYCETHSCILCDFNCSSNCMFTNYSPSCWNVNKEIKYTVSYKEERTEEKEAKNEH